MKWLKQSAGTPRSWVRGRFIFHILVDDNNVELGWVREDMAVGDAVFCRSDPHSSVQGLYASTREAKDALIAELVKERLDS